MTDLHEFEGSLWRGSEVIRENYSKGHTAMSSLADVKSALRSGGGYPCYFITRDGAALSFAAVREEFHQVCYDWMHGASTGWRVVVHPAGNGPDHHALREIDGSGDFAV